MGPITVEFNKFHISTGRGPSGQAVLSAAAEATYLSPKLREYINLLGGKKLAYLLADVLAPFDILPGTIAGFWKTVFPPASNWLRKLSYFSDKEGKTRIIGILDYWSQCALRPLHNELNTRLRKIKMDCTFDQGRFLQILEHKPYYYSVDLTAATDRMPITFQRRVLEHLIGKAKTDA